MSGSHEAEGRTVANWTGVTIVMVGSLIMALAVIWASTPIFIVGAVVVVGGIIAGKVLSMAGYGVDGHARKS
jgi:hypothetical protein